MRQGTEEDFPCRGAAIGTIRGMRRRTPFAPRQIRNVAMTKPSITIAILLALATGLAGARARAQNEGQEHLDHAIEAKILAENFRDLEKVIGLCESALEAGLDEANTRFAKRLLASTLIQRGWAVSEAILGSPLEDLQTLQRMARLRQIALSDLEEALTHDAEQPQGYLLIGRLQSLPGGDRQRAAEALEEAIRLSAEDDRTLAKALAARAALHDDVAKAEADLDRAVELAPGDVEILRGRAQFLAAQNRLVAALRDLERAIELEPDHALTIEARGAVLAGQGKTDEALESLTRAVELRPERTSAYLRRARIYMARNEPDRSLEDLDHVLSLREGHLTALFLRAAVHRQLGNKEKALADAEQLRRRAPQLGSARRLWMQLMGESGQVDAAIAELEQFREREEAKDVNLLVDLATLHLLRKDYASAVRLYSEILTEDPENAGVFKLRADAHLFLGKQSEAMADYEATLKIRPEDDGVLNNLAWLLGTSPDEELRDGKRSIELATEACKLTDYKQPHILSTLASGYAEIGDFETAINWSKKAIELAGESLKDALTKELESYQQGKPWREAMPPEPQVDFSPPGDSEAPSVETPSPDESKKPQPEGKSFEPEERAQEPAPEGEPSKP